MKKILHRFIVVLVVIIGIGAVIGPGAAWVRENSDLVQLRPENGQVVPTPDGEVYFQSFGEGQTIILAHGSGAWSQFWEGSIPALVNAGYHVIAFDMPPMGFSGPASSNNYDRLNQAKRIQALSRHIGGNPIFVGHSFGAGPMMEAAMLDPDGVMGVVIVDGALGLNSHDTSAPLPYVLRPMWLRHTLVSLTATNPMLTKVLLKQFVYQKDAITDRHIEILQQPLALKGATRDMAYWVPGLLVPPVNALSTRPDAFRKFAKPAQIIWGDKDNVTPLAQGLVLHDLLPNSDLTVLSDIGHIPHIEDPDRFNLALISALSKIRAAN